MMNEIRELPNLCNSPNNTSGALMARTRMALSFAVQGITAGLWRLRVPIAGQYTDGPPTGRTRHFNGFEHAKIAHKREYWYLLSRSRMKPANVPPKAFI